MNKHTPGPWAIHQNEFCQWISNESGKAQLAKTLQPAGMADETAKANARLIASAPELLEALQLIVDGLKYTAEFGAMQTTESGVTFQPLGTALAAIAKAKGEK